MVLKQKRTSKVVNIGGFSHVRGVSIGGNFPVVIQTMWKDRLSADLLKGDALQKIISKIEGLQSIGCKLLRFAVPDIQTAEILGELSQTVTMPLAADIHFDHKIALRCMDFPIAKIRINPGNIGGREKTAAVLEKAAEKKVPLRIGVNAGSLPQDLRPAEGGLSTTQALVLAAEREMEVFKEFGFDNYLVSMKAATIADTIEANKILSQRTDAPLHIGVTEAGFLTAGIVSNTAAVVPLLTGGIGDTVRVSLSASMEDEVTAAREIIRAASQLDSFNDRLKRGGVKIVSCPRCGRHGFDTHDFTNRWMNRLYAMDKDITVAVMGCEVNGPEEAKHADIGITGAGDKVLIFRRGKIVRTICEDEADKAFEEELLKPE
jgi:(E)-4-hydroxy-3-methylbut-2-enyl-diphosphate synthase